MRGRNNKKRIRIIILVLLALALGYAAVSTTLKITGTSTITKQNWNVYWANAVVTEGSKSLTAPTITEDTGDPTKTKVTWSVSFDEPGQFYEFTIDAVNAGSIDAKLLYAGAKVNGRALSALPEYIKYTVKYADGTTPAKNDILAKATKTGGVTTPTTKKYRIRIEYDGETATVDTINNMPQEGYTFDCTYEVDYFQPNYVDNNEPQSFATDSWETIAKAARTGRHQYDIGDTKEIQMDLDNDDTPETYTIRILNISKPSECKTTGFSQSACGFVVGFDEILYQESMNPYSSNVGTDVGKGSNGGWEYSKMRAYMNSGKYLEGTQNEIDYSADGVYSKLPLALRNAIIDTTVVTGHNENDSENSTTTDKLYLLSTKELYGKKGTTNIIENDSAEAETRQLDYYSLIGITTSNTAATIKKYSDSENSWWLRTPYSNSSYNFYQVTYEGEISSSYYTSYEGISPVFRLG